MFRLHVVPADGPPFDYLLEGAEVVIGRSGSCELVVADRSLSRRHSRFYIEGEQWLVEDLGSQNGTLLNGVRVERPTTVRAGDELRLSTTRIAVEEPDGPAQRPGEDEDLDRAIVRDAAELWESSTLRAPETADPEELRRHTERLRLLNEVHQALAGPVELEALLALILDRAFEHLEPARGAIILRRTDGTYRRAATREADGSEDSAAQGDDPYAGWSHTLIESVIEEGRAVLVPEVARDERFASAESIRIEGTRSLVAAPLLDREGVLGMIALTSQRSAGFTEGALELLVSLAAVAALRVRNLLLAVEAAERRRLEEEVRLARAIQVRLLPTKLPETPEWALCGGNLPSRGVSGDLYLLSENPERGEWIVLVADVSGKGIGAALLTASLEALVAGPFEAGLPPDEVCTRVSRRLHQRTDDAQYATAFVGVLDRATGSLRYANAGHNAPLLVHAGGEVERLAATGLPLGLMPGAEYRLAEAVLAPGDTLAVYTDGITEAVDPEEREYGPERLLAVLQNGRSTPLEELRAAVDHDLERFVRGTPQADDRTLVLLRRLEPPG